MNQHQETVMQSLQDHLKGGAIASEQKALLEECRRSGQMTPEQEAAHVAAGELTEGERV
jgi:hypothetical protein